MEVVNEREERTPHEELVEDLLAIVASFSGRLYGMRPDKTKKWWRVLNVRSVSSARFITRPLTRRKRELLSDLLHRFAVSRP